MISIFFISIILVVLLLEYGYIKTTIREIKYKIQRKKMQYKNLLDILKRKGCQSIEMNLSDMLHFIRYAHKMKYKEKLYFQVKKGKCICSTEPLIKIKENKQEDKQYNKLPS